MQRDTTLICKSIHHGNTRAVAERIASSLNALVLDPSDVSTLAGISSRLIGFGSGIYYGRFHQEIRQWIGRQPANAGQGRAAFIYSTAGLPFLSRLYHWPLKRALAKHGFEVVGEFSCRGHDTFGPLWLIGGLNRKHPSEKDLARAEAFALQLKQCLGKDQPTSAERPIEKGTLHTRSFVAPID